MKRTRRALALASVLGLGLAATAAWALPQDMTIVEYYNNAEHSEPVGIYVENCSGRRSSAGVVSIYTEVYRHRCRNGIEYDLPQWVWDNWGGL